jgi:alpha-tubulin suppressor-like RCC1 family protein
MNGWILRGVLAAVFLVACSGSDAGRERASTTHSPLSALARAPAIGRAGQLAAGFQQTCAVTPKGNVRCWGEDSNGQNPRDPATDMLPGVSNAVAVAVGDQHACALQQSGGILCWGNNWAGQLGNGTTQAQSGPVAVLYSGGAPVSDAVAVAAGGESSCLLNAGGSVWCWGYNGDGEAGNGTTASAQTEAVSVSMDPGVADISVGGFHACALRSNGTVFCWGMGVDGQLGNGYSQQTTPVQVSGLSGAKAIAAGGAHSCALMADTSVQCWGYAPYGELGNGTTNTTYLPQVVQRVNDDGTTGPLKGVERIRAGAYTSCAVTGDGRGWCWGYNAAGQLGNTTWGFPLPNQGYSNQAVAAPVAGAYHDANSIIYEGMDALTDLASGYQHTCGLRFDGTVWCWGANAAGQLGSGTQASIIPVQVQGAAFATTPPSIASGYKHTCMIAADGTARCWGGNSSGALGDGTSTDRSTPVQVLGAARWRTIAAGSYHTCALSADGAVLCWGYNNSGQVGDGTTTNRFSPVTVNLASGGLLGTATGIAAGEGTTCATINDGTVKCWGWGGEGNLGDGQTSAHHSTVPTTVMSAANQNLTGVIALASGNAHMCAVVQDGTVWCWGRNTDGELGNGTTTDSGYASQVPGLSGIVTLASGEFHTCAVDSSGIVSCWGLNQSAQLGDGTTTNRLSPTPINNARPGSAYLPAGTVSIVAGSSHTCALSFDGYVRCWGSNANGQVGASDGPWNFLYPETVLGILNHRMISLTAGNWHTCGVSIDGSVWCWGDNQSGDLGNGTANSNVWTPSQVRIAPGASAFSRFSAGCTNDYGYCNLASDCCGGSCLGGICLRSDQCSSTPYQGFGASGVVKTPANSSQGVHACLEYDYYVPSGQNYSQWDYVWGSGAGASEIQQENATNAHIVTTGYKTFQRDDLSLPITGQTCNPDGCAVANIGCFDQTNSCESPPPTCNVSYCVTPAIGQWMDTLLNTTVWQNGAPTCPSDWVLRTQNGCPTHLYDNLLVSLDISNPVVRAYQLASLIIGLSSGWYSAEGFDNFLLKNYLDYRQYVPSSGHFAPGTTSMVIRYHPDVYGWADPQFAVDAVNWLNYMKSGLHQYANYVPSYSSTGYSGLGVFTNFFYYDAPIGQPWVEQVLSNVDGVLDEGGFSAAPHQLLGVTALNRDQWLQRVRYMEETQRHHDAYAVVNEFGDYDSNGNYTDPSSCVGGPPACSNAQLCAYGLDGTTPTSPGSRADIQWALASYLMGKEQSAYTSSALIAKSFLQDGCAIPFAEYTAAAGIGTPCSSSACMYRSDFGNSGLTGSAYVRQFTNGLAIVNPNDCANPPNDCAATVALPSGVSFVDLYGKQVTGSTYPIQPHSGAVLLTVGSTLCSPQ